MYVMSGITQLSRMWPCNPTTTRGGTAMQLGNDFQGKQCARCRREMHSDPAFEDALWYHRVCLEQGKQGLQRANAMAARFGFPPYYPAHA